MKDTTDDPPRNERQKSTHDAGRRRNETVIAMLLTLLNRWEASRSSISGKNGNHSSTMSQLPLSGNSLLIVTFGDDRRYVELSTFVAALGGRVVDSLPHAGIVLWGVSDSNTVTPPDMQQLLRECRILQISVVATSWLERVSGLNEQEHWSEINVDAHIPHIPAVLALLEEEITTSEENLKESFKSWRRDAPSKLGRAISETFARLTKENPDQMEEDAIRRAIELSMLDVALVSYSPQSKRRSSLKHHQQEPHEILQVSKSASPPEIKSAYRKLARIHHPDKGGDPNVFEAIARAYRTMLSMDGGGDKEAIISAHAAGLKSTAHWDNELQDHRRLVNDLFQAHGGDLQKVVVKQNKVLEHLGLVAQDAGWTNRNEKDELIRNSCFYLSLATSYLHGIGALILDDTDGALIGETALQLKRVIEAAVVKAHPEWASQGMVGEEVQAFSDFLTYSLAHALLSDWAVVVFDSSSGFCDIYKGCHYTKLADTNDAWARSNTITLLYTPGHYQPLISIPTNSSSVGIQRPTLEEILSGLDTEGVFYVVTDGS